MSRDMGRMLPPREKSETRTPASAVGDPIMASTALATSTTATSLEAMPLTSCYRTLEQAPQWPGCRHAHAVTKV